MNYLAHLSLSFNVPEIMLGNFIADDIRLTNIKILPPLIQYGINLHRSIDRFTDDHQAFHQSVKRLKKEHKRYAPVVIDILNDHLLSVNWNHFHDIDLAIFRSNVYQMLAPLRVDLVDISLKHVNALLSYQYLKAYESKAGMTDVLSRMDKRTKFPSNFSSGIDDLYIDFEFYNTQFLHLYTDLLKHIERYKAANPIH